MTTPLNRLALAVHDFGRSTLRSRWKPVTWPLYKACDLLLLRLAMGVELPAEVEIGRGFVLAHGGRGTVVNKGVTIGDDVTVCHGVTLTYGVHLGDGVHVAPGAVVLEYNQVGERAIVGANSVVTKDVPSEHIAVGVPAQVRRRRPQTPGRHWNPELSRES